MKNNNMKEQILKKGMILVADKGFRNTGLSEILKAASVPKGSFYYYFDSKTDFGIELIRYAAGEMVEELKDFFSPETPPLRRIEEFFDYKIRFYTGESCSCSCLFGKLAQELSDEEPEFREALAGIFMAWENFFHQALEEAETAGEIKPAFETATLAAFAVSGWEGAILQGKLRQSPEPLTDFKKIFFSLLNPV